MATITDPEQSSPVSQEERMDLFSGGNHQGPRRPTRRSPFGQMLGLGVVLLVLLGGSFLAWSLLAGSSSSDGKWKGMTHTVTKESLLITVTDDGNVESASNVELKCKIEGGSSILWIIEDGTEVKKGDKLVELDKSMIDENLNAQKIVFENARAAKIQAEADVAVAEISIEEYLKGTFVRELKTIETNIVIALENLSSAQNQLVHSKTLSRRGFNTTLQLKADEFSVERAGLELELAQTDKMALEEFTKAKMLKELESLQETAEARERSEQAAFELEKAKLERLKGQLKNCVIIAPQNGMVVYANQTSRRGSQEVSIEEGAMVRQRQNIIRLPDLNNMQVKVTVHETKVDQVRPGMPARIEIQDQVLNGSVVSVANQPAPTSWFSSSVKEYETVVKIEGKPGALKPGMTAQVEILVAETDPVLTVPVSAVVEQRGKFYAWVETDQRPERRPLVLGLTNDKMIEIKDGVLEGEKVLLNPRALLAEARDETPAEDDQADARSRFSSSKTSQTKSGNPASPKAGPSPQQAGNSKPDDARAPGSRDSQKSAGQGRRGRGGSGRGGFNLMQFDKDGDKKVSKEEAPEGMRRFFDRMDDNKDGFIDAAEIAKMQQRMQQRGGQGGGRPQGAGGQGGQGGRP